jgi:hypothetical protein
MRAKDP